MADLRPATTRRPSFRLADQRREDGSAQRSRAVGLAVWGLALLAGCAWIIYQIVPHRANTFVLTGVVRYDRECELTPLPWQDAPWHASEGQSPEDARGLRWTVLPENITRGHELLKFADQFPEVQRRGSRDTLVLLLSAYGLAEGGVPYLLEADFAVREGRDHRLAVTELLEAVTRAGAGPRLVALDVFPLALDPRTGSLDLEFPRLLADVMRDMTATATRDPLWVLVSSRSGEIAQVSYTEHGSLFGRALRDGLDGYADLPQCLGNDDRRVSVGELYRYVAVRCRARSGNEQTPLLLCRGRGILVPGEEEDRTTVTFLPRRRDRSADSPDGAATDASATGRAARQGVSVVEGGAARAATDLGTAVGNAAARQPAAAPAATEPVAAPPPAADEVTPAAPAPTAAPAATAAGDEVPPKTGLPPLPSPALEEPFPALWQLHGVLANRTDLAASDVEPLDFAPQYWRWIEAQLVDWDLRQHWGSRAERIAATSPQSLLAELKALRRDPDADSTMLAATHWLAESDALYRRATAAASDPILQRAESAARTYLRLVYRTRDLVLWHARSALITSAGPERERDRLLADFVQELEAFSGSLAPLTGIAELAASELESRVAQLERQLGSADVPLSLLDRYRTLLESVDDDVQRAVGDQEIFCCLMSPLLTAAQRQTLYERLKSKQTRPPDDLGPEPARRWADIEELAGQPPRRSTEPMTQWYARLLALAVGDQVSDSQQGSLLSPKGLSDLQRQVTGNLDQFADQPPADAPAMIRQAVLLRLADHRDLSRGRTGTTTGAWFRVKPVYPDVVAVTIDPSEQLAVRPGGETAASVTVTFSSSNPDRRDVGWKLTFDEQELKVTQPGETRLLAPGEQSRVQLAGTAAQVQLLVEPRQPPTRDPKSAHLSIETTDGDRPTARRLTCLLPRDSIVEWGADSFVLGGDGNWIPVSTRRYEIPLDRRADAVLRLEPFPNRETRYGFLLKNSGETPKQLRVQLVAVPRRADSPHRWPQGRLSDGHRVFREILSSVQSSDQQLRSDVVVLAEAAVTLQADEEQAVPLQPPVPAAAGGATPPPAPPPAPTATNIAQGLVAVITGERPDERWWKWIEIVPVHPQNMVVARDARLDGDRLNVTLVPSPAASLLPGIKACLDQQAGQYLPLGEPLVITRGADEFVKTLAVEGVPRAVVLQPAGADLALWRDQRRDLRRVSLKGLSGETVQGTQVAYVSPEFHDSWKPPATEKKSDAAAAVELRRIGDTPPVFPRLKSLRVDLAVDAPLNAFVPGDQDAPPAEFVQVRLARLEDPRGMLERVYYEDRVWDAVGVVADGRLSIAMGSQQDLFLELPSRDGEFPQESAEYTLAARLFLSGYAPLSSPSAVRIVVDADPPQRVIFQGLPPSVTEGREGLSVRLSCRDLTGPRKVAYAFVSKPSDPLPAEAVVKSVTPVRELRDEWTAELEFATSDLKAAANGKANSYFLKAKVWDEAENAVAFPPQDAEPPVLRVTPPQAAPTHGELAVLVCWRKNNEPIGGATVTVSGPAGQKLVRESDASGRATFSNLDFGNYAVQVTFGRYKDAQTVELKGPRAEVTLFPSSL